MLINKSSRGWEITDLISISRLATLSLRVGIHRTGGVLPLRLSCSVFLPRLPLHQTEGDGAQDVEDDGDQELPLQSQPGRVEECDGAAERLHELEDGETCRGVLFERSGQDRSDL